MNAFLPEKDWLDSGAAETATPLNIVGEDALQRARAGRCIGAGDVTYGPHAGRLRDGLHPLECQSGMGISDSR